MTNRNRFIAAFTDDDIAIFLAMPKIGSRMLGSSLCDMATGDARLRHAWKTFPGATSAMAVRIKAAT